VRQVVGVINHAGLSRPDHPHPSGHGRDWPLALRRAALTREAGAEVPVSELTDAQRTRVIRELPNAFCKRLDDAQVGLLLANRGEPGHARPAVPRRRAGRTPHLRLGRPTAAAHRAAAPVGRRRPPRWTASAGGNPAPPSRPRSTTRSITYSVKSSTASTVIRVDDPPPCVRRASGAASFPPFPLSRLRAREGLIEVVGWLGSEWRATATS
jgi:hypothetical protein